jgi:hypothetical protein
MQKMTLDSQQPKAAGATEPAAAATKVLIQQ